VRNLGNEATVLLEEFHFTAYDKNMAGVIVKIMLEL
jgi:hypothetical protein